MVFAGVRVSERLEVRHIVMMGILLRFVARFVGVGNALHRLRFLLGYKFLLAQSVIFDISLTHEHDTHRDLQSGVDSKSGGDTDSLVPAGWTEEETLISL
jgi:hypothetical protein